MSNMTTLKTELRKFCDPNYSGFTGYPLTRAAAITKWRNAFDAYGLTCDDLSTDGLASGDAAGFASQLTSQWVGNDLSRTEGTEALSDAWKDYWTGATFGTSTPCPAGGECQNVPAQSMTSETSSAVTSVAGDTEVYTRLLALFQNPGDSLADSEAWIQSLANILHEESIESGNVNVHINGIKAGSPPITVTND